MSFYLSIQPLLFFLGLYLLPAVIGAALVIGLVRMLPLAGCLRLFLLSAGIGFFATPYVAGITYGASLPVSLFWVFAKGSPWSDPTGTLLPVFLAWAATACVVAVVLRYSAKSFALDSPGRPDAR